MILTRAHILQGRGPQNETDPANAVNGWWGSHLGEMVRNGSVPQARVDDMVCFI
jgi:beta-glucosidase